MGHVHKIPIMLVSQGIWAGCKPLSLEMFKQITGEGSEHLVWGVEKQEDEGKGVWLLGVATRGMVSVWGN